ncbi:MAG TPA: sulfotransferase [Acidimicrobiales bacterium]
MAQRAAALPAARPAWVEAVNRGDVAPIVEEAARPLTRDALLAEALALDGGDPGDGAAAFGDDAFLEPLDVFLAAIETEAELTVLGRWLTRRFLLRLLVGRLQLERYVAADPGVVEEEIRAPIFIAGAPRTGTTILFGLMVQDPRLRAPLGWELLRPVPPPRPGADGRPAEDGRVELAEAELRMLARVQPQMDAIHEYGARQPKECLSAMSFELRSEELTARYHVPSYVRWFQSCDMRPAYERHKLVLQVLQRRLPTGRWVLKSPAHLHQLPALLAVYPDARLAFTHRDPLAVLASVSSLVANLRAVHSDRVDLAEIGRYHLDLFHRSLDDLARRDAAGELPEGRTGHGRYADFVARPLDTVADLYRQLGLELDPATRTRMADHLAARPRGHRGEHHYDFADLGLDPAATRVRFARYLRHFGVPEEGA